MSKVIRILSLAVLLAAFMGCRKTPVDNGEEPGQEPQEYERYVKGNRFRSQILGEHITYSLFMPADYESNTEASYPVIYFLHGFGESSTKDWTKYMNVIASLEESQGVQPMIYVFPNGYNSYYSNTYDGKFPYMDMFINEPPVNASKKLNASPLCAANQAAKKVLSTPGTGSCDPKRITTIIAKVKRILFLSSLILNAFIKVLSIKSPQLFHQVPQFFLLQMH